MRWLSLSLCAVSWCYILPIVVRVLGKRKGKRLWKSFQGLQSIQTETEGQGFLKDMAPGSSYQSIFGADSAAGDVVMAAKEGEEEHGWNSPEAGKPTAFIVIPTPGAPGRAICVERAKEVQRFIECNELVQSHCRVAAYDSTLPKQQKVDCRRDANIIVLTMECLRFEVQESMAIAAMNPGGYETADTLKGGYAAFVPVGASAGDKSWLRIFTNLAIVVMETPEEFTKAAVRWKHNPPTVGRKDEEEAAAQANELAQNTSATLYHLLRTAKGLGSTPTAILMAKKMGEPLEHWDQLLQPHWNEPLPVLISKEGKQTLAEWHPKRPMVPTGEKIYEEKKVEEEVKVPVPRKNLPRYIVKAKREQPGVDDPSSPGGGGKIYKDARRFKDDMLKELRRIGATPTLLKIDPNDLYETVFVGFIVNLTPEEATALKRMPDIDEVERVGAKLEMKAPRPETAPDKKLSNRAWSRTLGKRGQDSSHVFAWFAPTMARFRPSIADAVGAPPPGRMTFADTSANVGRAQDARDRARKKRLRAQAKEKRRRAAVGRKRAPEVPLNLSAEAARNLRLLCAPTTYLCQVLLCHVLTQDGWLSQRGALDE